MWKIVVWHLKEKHARQAKAVPAFNEKEIRTQHRP